MNSLSPLVPSDRLNKVSTVSISCDSVAIITVPARKMMQLIENNATPM